MTTEETGRKNANGDAAMSSMIRLEHFVDVVLRQSLEKVLRDRDVVYTMTSQCCQLRELLGEMRELSLSHSSTVGSCGGGHSLVSPLSSPVCVTTTTAAAVAAPRRNDIMVDVGNHFFAQCTVADASFVWVNLGCGVVLPMSTAEANVFLEKREKLLRERASRLSKEALRIKYRIRLVMEAITQLYDRASGQQV